MENALTTSLNDIEAQCKAGYYDYIIIGSGMGGGTLARLLIDGPPDLSPQGTASSSEGGNDENDPPPRVLVIEQGGLLFSTHCTNTPTPGWYVEDGPSMSTDIVFQAFKSCVTTVSADSVVYAGGPVHCLGGRSNVWGMYTPPIDKASIQKNFGQEITNYLFDEGGYTGAYYLLSNGGSLETPYPMTQPVIEVQTEIQAVKNMFDLLGHVPYVRRGPFRVCPMGAEFVARRPSERLYQMAMGGYSAVTWMLAKCYNSSEALTILPRTQVRTVNYEEQDLQGGKVAEGDTRRPKITSITVFDPDSERKQRTIHTGGAKVILSCGTIDTAVIALRSGLAQLPKTYVTSDLDSKSSASSGVPASTDAKSEKWSPEKIGAGLTDHDIWGVRFDLLVKRVSPIGCLSGRALRLQSWATLGTPDYSTIHDLPYGITPPWLSAGRQVNNTTACLINVTINATSFLGSSSKSGIPKMYLGKEGKLVPEAQFEYELRDSGDDFKRCSIQVVFELSSPLKDENKVLNLPRSNPTIRIPTREDNTRFLPAMREFAATIARTCVRMSNQDNADAGPHGGKKTSDDALGAARVGPPPPLLERVFRSPPGSTSQHRESASGGPQSDADIKLAKETVKVFRNLEDVRADLMMVERAPFGVVAHEVGTMRLGQDSEGVVDKDLKVKGVEGLYVCDLSIFPWSPTANPSLTLVALARRLAMDLEKKRRGKSK
ncbi:hypothetical protein TWF730_001946 [Orbilia blumenaviensis]|uniref:Glucose-methanol-choline oxidoreductase C-terminal domain-containing protein n=1 Tax=Orbilia blumenaviensis TaxID=1796055 RepID=A0AAV9UCI6_9PEZI